MSLDIGLNGNIAVNVGEYLIIMIGDWNKTNMN